MADNFDTIMREMDALRAEEDSIHKRLDKKRVELEAEAAKAIIGRGILTRIKWRYDTDYRDAMVLFGQGDSKELDGVWRHDYHASIDLVRGVRLREDDGQLRLIFTKPQLMVRFIKEQSLKINITTLVAKYEEHREQADKELEFLKRLKALYGKEHLEVEDCVFEANIERILAYEPNHFRNYLHSRINQFSELLAPAIKSDADKESVPALRLALAIALEKLNEYRSREFQEKREAVLE